MKTLMWIVFVVLATLPCIAQDTAKNVTALTESDAVARCLAHSRKEAFLTTDIRIAEYRLESAGWIENPELRIRNLSDQSIDDDFDELQIGLRWDPPQPGARREDRRQAEMDVCKKTIRSCSYRLQLITRVRRTYADVIMRDELAAYAAKRAALESERIELVERMVDLGRRSVVYLTKAKMWLSESRNELSRALKRQNAAHRKLAALTGSPGTMLLQTEDLPVISASLEKLLDIALAHRSEIELADQQALLAREQHEAERKKRWPWPTVIDLSHHVESESSDRMELMIGFQLPLFNWNCGNIKARNLAVTRKENERAAVREQIEQELTDAFEIYTDALLDWQNFQRDTDTIIAETETIIGVSEEHVILPKDEILELKLVVLDTRKLLSVKQRQLAYSYFDVMAALGLESAWEPAGHKGSEI